MATPCPQVISEVHVEHLHVISQGSNGSALWVPRLQQIPEKACILIPAEVYAPRAGLCTMSANTHVAERKTHCYNITCIMQQSCFMHAVMSLSVGR
jgi:hypothetical protein